LFQTKQAQIKVKDFIVIEVYNNVVTVDFGLLAIMA
jgi:hypothetical protein